MFTEQNHEWIENSEVNLIASNFLDWGKKIIEYTQCNISSKNDKAVEVAVIPNEEGKE